VDGRIIVNKSLKNKMGCHALDWFGSSYGQVAGCCESSDELSGSIKCGELLV
jgi:hypothetical protein